MGEVVSSTGTLEFRSFDGANCLQSLIHSEAGTSAFLYDDNGNLILRLPAGGNAGILGVWLVGEMQAF